MYQHMRGGCVSVYGRVVVSVYGRREGWCVYQCVKIRAELDFKTIH